MGSCALESFGHEIPCPKEGPPLGSSVHITLTLRLDQSRHRVLISFLLLLDSYDVDSLSKSSKHDQNLI